jgi:hypothetical protein
MMRWIHASCWGTVVLVCGVAACGSDGGDSDGGNGTENGEAGNDGAAGDGNDAAGASAEGGTSADPSGGGAGASGSGTGTGGTTGPSPRGASAITLESDCGVGDAPITIPWEPSEVVSETELGTRVPDGQYNAQVTCTVSSAGGGFDIDGRVQQGDRWLSVRAQVVSPGGAGYEGLGSVGHFDETTGELTGTDCTVTVGPQQDIAASRVWGSFTCPSVSTPDSGDVSCAASGSFVFENCSS